MANFKNHPFRLRTGKVSEDCYYYATGQALGLPPNKAPIVEKPNYDEWVRLTTLGINKLPLFIEVKGD